MSGEGPESVPTSADPRSRRPTKKRALSPASAQAASVGALFARPDREIRLPPAMAAASSSGTTAELARPRRPAPPEIVANVQGSSAGAGSGEFHVYKASRRREYERLRDMDADLRRQKHQEQFESERAQRERRDAEKTRKNREKRERIKARKERAKASPLGHVQAVAPAEQVKAPATGRDDTGRDDTGRDGTGRDDISRDDVGRDDGHADDVAFPDSHKPLASPATNAPGLIIHDDD